MFKSSKKRESNRLTFQQQLNQRLNLIKEETPIQKANKNKEMVTILDEVVNQLKTPIERTPKKQPSNQINQWESLAIDQNSSISLNSKIRHQQTQQIHNKKKDHISNLVSNSQVIKLLVDNYGNCSEEQKISLQHFIKKIYPYYLGISIKEQELSSLRNKLKLQLTTTDPQYLSLNALQIVAKRSNLIQYFQSAYIAVKIQQQVNEFEKKYKRMLQQFSEKQQKLKDRQFRLNYNEEDYQNKITQLMNKQRSFNQKFKDFNLRQKQLRKSIEEKTMKLYENYLSQFNEKIKETQKRLINTQKNIKYKIQILQRRSQTLRTLLIQKNDLKNKKIMGENEAKVRLRKIEKQMQQIEKKHQAQIQIFQRQEKDLMKSISILQQKVAKSQKKCTKYKQKISQQQQEIVLATQQIQKLIQKSNELQTKTIQHEQEPKVGNQIKTIRQKTNRSSKNKKKYKSQNLDIIALYQIVLQSLSSSTTHSQHQSTIQKMMKTTIKQVPQLIYLLTSYEDQLNLYRQPHYLVLNIAKTIIHEFYYLCNTQQESNYSNNSKFKSADIQELLKYPYTIESRFSIFLLFLQIYDWNQASSAKFFSKTIQAIVEQVQRRSIFNENHLKEHQIKLLTSAECSYFIVNNFYLDFSSQLQNIQKDSISNVLTIVIAISDLLICLIKVQQDCIFDRLSESKIEKIICSTLILVLDNILKVYSGSQKNKGKNNANKILFELIESIQELAQKLSIFIQRYYYKYSNKLAQIPQILKVKTTANHLKQLNRLNGNRHSLIIANLQNVLQMLKQCQ